MTSGERIGYGQPPRTSRFKKGQSGNPRGRPKNRHRRIPYDLVLGQMVTIRENGKERRVTAAEAFLLQLTRNGLAGDSAATRASLEVLETARAKREEDAASVSKIVIEPILSGADALLQPLGIAQKKYPADERRVRWELNPWIVEAALDRLGEKELCAYEQREVWRATRTPRKVRWPSWWCYFGE